MSKPKILIVEDEVVVALELKTLVEKINCEVTDIVFTQKKVLNSIKRNEPNIILMDIKLGKNDDGIEIAQEIQKIKNIPIFYLTAFSNDEVMQRAFKTNPIGYVIKPFKPEELKTNIQLALHKINVTAPVTANKDYFYLGEGFSFDTKTQNLYFKNKSVKLGRKEKSLLSILIDANYKKVHFTNLEEIIWDGNKASPSALRTLVYRLKGKLGNNIIEMTYGYGYSLKKPLS